MNIPLCSVAGIGLCFFGFGLHLYIFPTEIEYVTPPTIAYIDGATPPKTEAWEMY